MEVAAVGRLVKRVLVRKVRRSEEVGDQEAA